MVLLELRDKLQEMSHNNDEDKNTKTYSRRFFKKKVNTDSTRDGLQCSKRAKTETEIGLFCCRKADRGESLMLFLSV